MLSFQPILCCFYVYFPVFEVVLWQTHRFVSSIEKRIFILHLLFRCQCGLEKTDHEEIYEIFKRCRRENELEPWHPDDVNLSETDAFGEIEFDSAGKPRWAKVTTNFTGSLFSKSMFSIFFRIS